MRTCDKEKNGVKIYLAGPLFSTAEREFNVQLKTLLEKAGHLVWLPQEKEPRGKPNARSIFEIDVKGIRWAEIVVANMDGPDPDSGTCWECGYAYRKRPIIVYRTDFRQGDQADVAPYNLMLTESADDHMELPFADVSAVGSALLKSISKIERKLKRR